MNDLHTPTLCHIIDSIHVRCIPLRETTEHGCVPLTNMPLWTLKHVAVAHRGIILLITVGWSAYHLPFPNENTMMSGAPTNTTYGGAATAMYNRLHTYDNALSSQPLAHNSAAMRVLRIFLHVNTHVCVPPTNMAYAGAHSSSLIMYTHPYALSRMCTVSIMSGGCRCIHTLHVMFALYLDCLHSTIVYSTSTKKLTLSPTSLSHQVLNCPTTLESNPSFLDSLSQ